MKATGHSDRTLHSNMTSAVSTAYHPSSDTEAIITELISLSRPIIPPDAEVLDKTVSPLTAPNSVPPQTLRPVFPGPTTQSVKPQLDTVLNETNLEGFLAPLDVTEPTATRRSSRILNKQSASQELPSPSLENPTTTQLSFENEQISNALPSQTLGQPLVCLRMFIIGAPLYITRGWDIEESDKPLRCSTNEDIYGLL